MFLWVVSIFGSWIAVWDDTLDRVSLFRLFVHRTLSARTCVALAFRERDQEGFRPLGRASLGHLFEETLALFPDPLLASGAGLFFRFFVYH